MTQKKSKLIRIITNTIVIRIKFKDPNELREFSTSKEFGDHLAQIISKSGEYDAKFTSEVY